MALNLLLFFFFSELFKKDLLYIKMETRIVRGGGWNRSELTSRLQVSEVRQGRTGGGTEIMFSFQICVRRLLYAALESQGNAREDKGEGTEEAIRRGKRFGLLSRVWPHTLTEWGRLAPRVWKGGKWKGWRYNLFPCQEPAAICAGSCTAA